MLAPFPTAGDDAFHNDSHTGPRRIPCIRRVGPPDETQKTSSNGNFKKSRWETAVGEEEGEEDLRYLPANREWILSDLMMGSSTYSRVYLITVGSLSGPGC